MESTAVFSSDRKYRYSLTRIWHPHKPLCLFIGLNPSTAHEIRDDPTVVKCIGLSSRWGYGGFYVCNLFALVTAYPEALALNSDPIGKETDDWISRRASEVEAIVVCWGESSRFTKSTQAMIKSREGTVILGGRLYCLGLTKTGQPRHPLYVPYGTLLQSYQGKIAA